MSSLPTVYFDNYNAYSEWGFFLVTKTIEPPKPKVYKVEIPGGNGDLDITESVFGGIAYNDRKITMKFRAIGPQLLWTALKTNILAAIHGRRMQMIFDDELSYYYEGRVEVTDFHYNFDVAEMTVEADCNPFKFEISNTGKNWLWDPFDFVLGEITDDTISVSGTKTVTLAIKSMPVCPEFRSTAALTLTYNKMTKTIPANKNIKFYDIYLTEGSHKLTFKGNATLKIIYNNGVL